MDKFAKTDFYIMDAIKKRWSPRSFNTDKAKDETIKSEEKIQRIFEAARWAPSAYNAQPWRFIIGFRNDDTHKIIQRTLVDKNKSWAKDAFALIIAIAKNTLDDNVTPNPTALYDLGQSVANMSLQATAEKLHMHQMAGFSAEEAIKLLEIPDGYTPVTAIALGYRDSAFRLPHNLRTIELTERERHPSRDFVFVKKFGEKTDLLKKAILYYMED
ncbi:MAG: hypothetical protein A2X12_09670 [Bacteroidetes bacterium GWE2_29_8]|nr:MAG: hypothetical protein A2X12_09670 [Bacteroidetes bacterium GWE2_29_8]OFY15357.1 MAG: hypothetical protein A2X02_02880 [Bacteroidetes bacterium GWF2_29_10]